MAELRPISIMLYKRLLSYLRLIKQRPEGSPDNISSATIAHALGLNDVQVRKDLASVSSGGKPKIGYITKDLVSDLEHFLGHDNCSEAVLVGAGNLGKALISYENFENYGLKIVAAFDADPRLVGTSFKGLDVFSAERIPDLCRRLKVHIGIIAVPAARAQQACDALLEGGIMAVWNFAPVNLQVPESAVVRNEDMGASLALLMKSLKEKMSPPGENARTARPGRRRP
ncbi:MAG: redox-sensing transcriptional repressor Rex [Deltaproteobacteria bacterium]|jgi:redox-sensing transcriptional repressor|nr:redox-sensing transcriptional repressor Rex [Deltaproteobacteria bacterium]